MIPGTNICSNHGSGTAIDINASRHPWHSLTYKPIVKIKIRLLARKYGLRWGGDYKYSKDEMHFEIVDTPAQVKVRIAQMKLSTPKVRK